jgi:RimJ/RimL family protein N-acetyltransferase
MRKTRALQRTPTPTDRYRSATRPPRRESRIEARAAPPADAGEPFTTQDGRPLVLRPIHPDDADALRRGFARLTPEQVRLRTFHRVNELSAEVAERMTNIDPATTTAWVAVDGDGEIRGEARLYADPVTDSAEFGVAVDPAFTGQGIGRRLMQRLIDDARRRGLHELWGDVLAENHTMLDFVKALGAERHPSLDDPGVLRVHFPIAKSKRS